MATLEDVLDDLCSRFLLNLPAEELVSFERLSFQIEEAHWFYEDFYREQHPELPNFGLRQFVAKILQHCPPLKKYASQCDKIYEDFLKYKLKVPVCGVILLNPDMQKVLLVKGWSSRSSWSFPQGKINRNELEIDCAIRELFEETGFDAKSLLLPNVYLEKTVHQKTMRLYIVTNVSEETLFATRTRKEISQIAWQYIDSLPSFEQKASIKGAGQFFMICPFVADLRKWIENERQVQAKKEQTTSETASRLMAALGFPNLREKEKETKPSTSSRSTHTNDAPIPSQNTHRDPKPSTSSTQQTQEITVISHTPFSLPVHSAKANIQTQLAQVLMNIDRYLQAPVPSPPNFTTHIELPKPQTFKLNARELLA